jgi:hypothetical protein
MLVSLLGYPSQKLRNWHDDAKEDTEAKVARVSRSVFEGIRRGELSVLSLAATNPHPTR